MEKVNVGPGYVFYGTRKVMYRFRMTSLRGWWYEPFVKGCEWSSDMPTEEPIFLGENKLDAMRRAKEPAVQTFLGRAKKF